jgi:hypothetical protein
VTARKSYVWVAKGGGEKSSCHAGKKPKCTHGRATVAHLCVVRVPARNVTANLADL